MTTPITKKRIVADIRNYLKSSLANVDRIYCKFNEEDIFDVRIVLFGPKETPYQDGAYAFTFRFPKDYPRNPPHVKLVTLYKDWRVNPNLYTNGKVCLSLLGTWQGPSWTSCCTMEHVLISLQAILNENPIHNEPGWENENGQKCRDYNRVTAYNNIRVAVINMILYPPHGYEDFKDILLEQYFKNRDYFYKYLEQNKKMNGKKIYSSIYNNGYICDFKWIKDKLAYIDEKYGNLNINTETKQTEESQATLANLETKVPQSLSAKAKTKDNNDSSSNKEKKPKSVRKSPNEPAKQYEVGFEKLSPNDNKTYVVKLIKNDVKRWVLKK